MSQVFEKETASSIAKSLFGALAGLGSGFVFLFLALVALTASASIAQGDGAPGHEVTATLRRDLVGMNAGSLRISPDRRTLTFQQGKRAVKYVFDPSKGEVKRIIDGTSHRLVKLKGLSFEQTPGLLHIQWRTANTNQRSSWALNRWGKQKS